VLIPLVVAARKRDKDSVWDLPIAGMILSVSQIVVLILPIYISQGTLSLATIENWPVSA